MKKLAKTSAVAKAFGTIAWGADTTLRIVGKGVKKGVSALRNRPKYHILLHIDGVVKKEWARADKLQLNKALEILDEVEGSRIEMEGYPND